MINLILPEQRVPIESDGTQLVLALVHEGNTHGLRLLRVHLVCTKDQVCLPGMLLTDKRPTLATPVQRD